MKPARSRRLRRFILKVRTETDGLLYV